MTPVALALAIRGLIAVLLVVGGFACLYIGYRLLLLRRDERTPKTSFDLSLGKQKISFSAGTASTVAVLTSAVWVVGALVAAPSFRQNPGSIQIASSAQGPLEFAPGETALTEKDKAALDEIVAQFAHANADRYLEIRSTVAVAPSEGPDAASEFARLRAEAVQSYLTSAGLTREHMSIAVNQVQAEPGNALDLPGEGRVMVVPLE